MNHEDYKAMLPLQALSTLDGDEARALDQHLAACAECRAGLVEWQETTGALAHAANPLEPSAGLRDRIVSAVRAEALSSRVNNVVPISRSAVRAQPLLARSWGFQAIAAAVICVGLIVGLVVLWRQNLAARAEVARLSEQMKETASQLDREREALEFFAKPGMRMTELAGTKDAPAAHAMLAVDGKSGRAVLLTEGLPATPADKAYEVWFIPKGHSPMAGKMFTVDATGRAMLSDQVPPEARENSVIAITLEPKRGVDAPTGAIYLSSPSS